MFEKFQFLSNCVTVMAILFADAARQIRREL
jgi:hypothetical protein